MTTAPTPISTGRASRRVTQILLAVLIVLVGAGVILLARHDWSGASTSTGGTRGSGVAAVQTRGVPAFTGIDLAGSNVLTVRVGGKRSVIVHADDNLIARVTTHVHSGQLVVATAPGSFTTVSPMHVDVTVPTLTSARLSGSGVVAVEGVEARNFAVDVPGSGVLRVSGSTTGLRASLSGSGDVQLENLIARDVTATVAGSGRLQVNATRSLRASVTGSGAIFYRGYPASVARNVTGSGAIIAG